MRQRIALSVRAQLNGNRFRLTSSFRNGRKDRRCFRHSSISLARCRLASNEQHVGSPAPIIALIFGPRCSPSSQWHRPGADVVMRCSIIDARRSRFRWFALVASPSTHRGFMMRSARCHGSWLAQAESLAFDGRTWHHSRAIFPTHHDTI